LGGGGALGGIEAVWVRVVSDIAAIRTNKEEMRVSFMDGLRAVRLLARGSVRQIEIGNWKFQMEAKGWWGSMGEAWTWFVDLDSSRF
jgi:hypothetical protein